MPVSRPSHFAITSSTRLAWARNQCENLGLRATPARRKILEFLAEHRTPVNLDLITAADPVRRSCDGTTVYRTLMLLKSLEVVRQVSIRHRKRYFILNVPGETSAYLICRCCGEVSPLPAMRGLPDLEREVAAKGYAEVYHELEFHGVCPQCQKAGKGGPAAAKLPVR